MNISITKSLFQRDKPKLPAIIENARNLFISKVSNNFFTKKLLRSSITH